MRASFYNSFLTILIFITFQACGGTSVKRVDTPDTPTDIPNEPPIKEKKEFTLYEDAEDGNITGWVVLLDGKAIENVDDGAQGSSRSIFLHENWLRDADGNFTKDANGYATNAAHYEFPMQNDKYFVLEFDKKKKISEGDELFCFTVGMRVDTQDGIRQISFNTFFDREKMPPDSQTLDGGVIEYIFPLSMDYVNDQEIWKHLKFDLSAYLHKFEPNNNILKTTTFYFEGGDDYIDNLQLSSR